MAKDTGGAGTKKECPSCGLGVAPDSKICEFCGWNFNEEDEWILQIERLERELLKEKQKFEPGSVDQKIEATLHTPAPRLTRPSQPAEEAAEAERAPPVKAMKVRGLASPGRQVQGAPEEPAPEERESSDATPESAETTPRHVRSVKAAEEPEPEEAGRAVRRVRTVAPAAESEVPRAEPPADSGGGERKSKKVRVVRKTKQ